MKRLMALAIIALLAITLIPAASFAEEHEVTYSGTVVDLTGNAVGSTFYYYLDVSENSGMFSGHWLIDYPEDYVSPQSVSVSWSGGITALINQSIENDEQNSDVPAFVYNQEYEGMTGDIPYGEAGNWYTVIGMYLTSFDFMGVQQGGHMVRVRYTLTAIPYRANCSLDANGYYIEVPTIALESTYFVIDPETGANGENHELVNVEAGRLYFTPQQDPQDDYTVTFYDYSGNVALTQQVPAGGAATPPELPRIVDGIFVFTGWDKAYENVTEDMAVYPVYLLIGDVDWSNTVTTADALAVMRNTLMLSMLEDAQLVVADIDGNGSTSTGEALAILRYCLGLISVYVD